MKSCKNLTRRSQAAAVIASLAGCALAPQALASETVPPTTYALAGVVRDFKPGVADFNPSLADSLPYSTGNVMSQLDQFGLPVFKGGGCKVVTNAYDAQGRPIAPGAAVASGITSFTITNGKITSTKAMAAKITVIGSAMAYLSGSTPMDCRVTMQVMNGSTIIQPFGAFSKACTGNINDGKNPRSVVLSAMVPAGTALSIEGKSWISKFMTSMTNNDSDWLALLDVSSTANTVNIRALKNGDAVPTEPGFGTQLSAKAFLAPYIAAGKIKLAANQVIYLFELATTDKTQPVYDLQDMVVLVEMANDPAFFSQSPVLAQCGALADVPGTLGASDGGGIASGTSFANWFASVPAVNSSVRRDIMLTKGTDGVYSYVSTDFHPIDGEVYGNQGLAHNRGFTYAIDANVTYSKCSGQYFEYSGDGDAWVFVNGKLALDMGGRPAGSKQVVALDRLGLTDGSNARIQFFYAQRCSNAACISIRTNMMMSTPVMSVPALTSLTD